MGKKKFICQICSKGVTPTDEYTVCKDRWFINIAIVGDSFEVAGHKECCENVNNLVIIPNRLKLISFLREKELDNS